MEIIPIEHNISRYDFFISYARPDEEWSRWIAWTLEKSGYTTFFPEEDILPGEQIDAAIDAAIENSHYLLTIISPDYLYDRTNHYSSQDRYLSLKEAANRTKEPLTSIIVRPVNPDDLPSLETNQSINLLGLDESGADQALLSKIKTLPDLHPPFSNIEEVNPHFNDKPAFPGIAGLRSIEERNQILEQNYNKGKRIIRQWTVIYCTMIIIGIISLSLGLYTIILSNNETLGLSILIPSIILHILSLLFTTNLKEEDRKLDKYYMDKIQEIRNIYYALKISVDVDIDSRDIIKENIISRLIGRDGQTITSR